MFLYRLFTKDLLNIKKLQKSRTSCPDYKLKVSEIQDFQNLRTPQHGFPYVVLISAEHPKCPCDFLISAEIKKCPSILTHGHFWIFSRNKQTHGRLWVFSRNPRTHLEIQHFQNFVGRLLFFPIFRKFGFKDYPTVKTFQTQERHEF